MLIEFNKNDANEVKLGKVILTQTGQELAPICGAQRNEEFYLYIIEKWVDAGYALSTPLFNE